MTVVVAWVLGLSAGFVVSLGLASVVLEIYMGSLRDRIRQKAKERAAGKTDAEAPRPEEAYDDDWALDIPASEVGIVERICFTTLVALNLPDVGLGMFAWVGMKLAYNWDLFRQKGTKTYRSLGFSALLGNLLSMLFAVIGGVICRVVVAWWMSG